MRDRIYVILTAIMYGPYPRWQRRYAAWLLDMNPWLSRPRGE